MEEIWKTIEDYPNYMVSNMGRVKSLYSGANIHSCCYGKLKTAYGYKWGFADEYEKIPFKVFDLELYRKKVV